MAQTTERVARLETLVEELLARAHSTASDALNFSPAPGEWSPMQVLAHTAEITPFWAHQARVVSERDEAEKPFGRSTFNPEDDPDRLLGVEQNGFSSLATIEGLLRDGLTQAVIDLRAIRPDRWEQTGRHANGQMRTVASIVDQLLIAHLEEHTRQLDYILGRV